MQAIDYALTIALSSVFNVCLNFTRCLLQTEDMRCQLNVTLLKAVLQIHQAVTLLDDHISRENSGSNTLNTAMEELALQEKLLWKRNQVTALIAAFCVSSQLVHTPRT